MKKISVLIFGILGCTLALFLVSPQQVLAQSSVQNFTIIISQIRGQECCSPGGTHEFTQQVEQGTTLKIPLTFTLRSDALLDPRYTNIAKKAQQQGHEIGLFLEITPELAAQSGVPYQGTTENWYEAQVAYPVGYSQEDRKKLIDTAMESFHDAFGEYPKTTTAWILDSWSLRYLKEEYGVQVHQITREQWGTDSYTLSGGPPHLPYYPSPNWGFIPLASDSGQMPLMVRQTISDPVWNYGDITNSYTSQPNDYRLENRGFEYFTHLFTQAHSQPIESVTFALLGLENSMPEIDQQEFFRQLKFVAEWREQNPARKVLTASQLAEAWANPSQTQLISVHQGKDQERGEQEQSWWITTPHYRARVRLSNKELFISDLRLYSPELKDPYENYQAEKLSYWVVPFLLDGSRFWHDDQNLQFDQIFHDTLWKRPAEYLTPTRIQVASGVEPQELKMQKEEESIVFLQGDTVLMRWEPDSWLLPEKHITRQTNRQLQSVFLSPLAWSMHDGKVGWRVSAQPSQTVAGYQIWRPIPPTNTDFASERETRYPLLFPEVKVRPLDPQQSSLIAHNRYARAERNPARLVFFPKDAYGYPALLDTKPEVTIAAQGVTTTQTRPNGSTGIVYIDVSSEKAQSFDVTVKFHDLQYTKTVYFAPNCKKEWKLCLVEPKYSWWFVRTFVGDWTRKIEAKFSRNK